MAKYDALKRHLRSSGKPRVTLTFSQIEKLLGSRLPSSARLHAAWWSNDSKSHAQARAWQNSGYRTERVDLRSETLVFAVDKKASKETPAGRELFGAMKGTTVVTPGVDLTKPVAPDWGRLEDE